jgi:peptidyl-prolyl cis-trans isomerase A (cyclophilin A)
MRGSGVLLTALALVMAPASRGLAQAPQTSSVLVIFETELGNMTMAIDVEHAPVTAKNFLRYVDEKFYDEGAINPARRRDQFPPIPMEPTSVTGLKNIDGALSMARNGPDTATASFSIAIGDQPEMDFGGKRNADGQGFAVFGRVVAGMDVVKKIQGAHTGSAGAYRTESLDPPIKITRAYRKS